MNTVVNGAVGVALGVIIAEFLIKKTPIKDLVA